MIWSLSIQILILVVVPILIPFCLFAEQRAKAFFSFPLALGLYFGFYGTLAALSYDLLDFGWLKYTILSTVSVVLVRSVLHFIGNRFEKSDKAIFGAKVLLWVAVLAFVAVFDTGWILSKQGWSLLDHQSYFRPPLSNDLQRHVIVINALLRHEGSPFVPNTQFLYQLFWHHWAATLAVLFPVGFSRYPIVTALTVVTAFLFFFVFIWALYLIRPVLFRRFRTLLVVFPILFAHADIYNFMASLILEGHAGIEADWSFTIPVFFRCFTLKLVSLSAPQHAIFLLFLSLFLLKDRIVPKVDLRSQFMVEFLFFLFAFLSSPLVSGFFFIPYCIYEAWQVRKIKPACIGFLSKWIFFSLAAILCFKITFGFWPQDLVMRPGTSNLSYFPGTKQSWYLLPLLFVGTSGTLGMLLLIVLGLCSRRGGGATPVKGFGKYLAVMLGGNIIFHYGVTDHEVRRHFAILSSFLSSFLVVLGFPHLRGILRRSMLQLQFGAVLVLSLALHGYYLYSYTQKPSVIDPTLAWKDYFDLNAILQAKYPRVPVIGLSDPKGSGLEYPVAQEVTTSFSIPAHTVIHTRLSWEQFRVLRKIMNSGHSLPYAGAMGYQYIVWGPVEERGWGAATRKRFISSENLVERVGTVSLYRYADTLRSRFAAETDTSSPQFYLKVADAFANEGWKDEAFGYYFQALKLNPDFIEGHVHLAQALEQENRDSEAKEHREFAEKIRERLDRRSLGQRSDGG